MFIRFPASPGVPARSLNVSSSGTSGTVTVTPGVQARLARTDAANAPSVGPASEGDVTAGAAPRRATVARAG